MFGVDSGGGLAWLQTSTWELAVDNTQEIVYYCVAKDCKLTKINNLSFWQIQDFFNLSIFSSKFDWYFKL